MTWFDAFMTYKKGDEVQKLSLKFVSLEDNNLNHNPLVSPKQWKVDCADCAELRAALLKAVKLIEAWHNMPTFRDQPISDPEYQRMKAEAWEIYKAHAPEMRPIMKALEKP